jgi:hypothetical protein
VELIDGDWHVRLTGTLAMDGPGESTSKQTHCICAERQDVFLCIRQGGITCQVDSIDCLNKQ